MKLQKKTLKQSPKPLARPSLPALTRALHCALAAASMAGVAHAQPSAEPSGARADENVSTLPGIVVKGRTTGETATGPVSGFAAKRGASGTKTDTPLIETPQSLSVVTRDELDTRAPTTLRDAIGYTPGVQVDQGGDLRSEWFSLRGFRATQNVYRDGLRAAYVPGGFSNGDLDPYGLERIEVLRGPSSVLYGQAQPGGVVNLVTKRPLDTAQNEIELSVGSFHRKQAAFDFSGPVSADGEWSYRLTGLLRDSDTQSDFVRNDRIYIAPALTWRPSAQTSLTLLANYQKDSKGSTANYDLPLSGTLLPNVNGQIPLSRMNSEPSFDRYKKPQTSIGYLFDHQFDDTWSFRQNLRFSRVETDYAGVYSYALDPVDERTVSRGAFTQRDKADVLTVDNQVQAKWTQGRWDHTMLFGLDYRSSKSKVLAADGVAPSIDVFNPVYGAPVEDPPTYEDSKTRMTQLGLYAQDQIKLDKRWVFLLGGRWDRAKSKTDNPLVSETHTEQSDTKFTGRAGLVYLFDNGLAPYASYSTSFNPEIGKNQLGDAFKPTQGKQAEVGLRYQPADGRSVFSVALFDLVQSNVVTDAPPPVLRIQTGEVRSRGLELEQKLSLSNQLNLTASYTYLDAKITKSNDIVGGLIPREGKRPGGVPQSTATVWADYSGALPGLTVGAGVRYNSRTLLADTNINSTPSRALVDAMLRYEWDRYTLSLNASNLLDKEYVSQCSSDSYGYCTYGLRRNITATLRYRW